MSKVENGKFVLIVPRVISSSSPDSKYSLIELLDKYSALIVFPVSGLFSINLITRLIIE